MNNRDKAEAKVVQAIKNLRKTNKYAPSFREVSVETGIPLGTVHSICVDLAERGIVTYHPKIARSLDA
jgi:hypothetical protein